MTAKKKTPAKKKEPKFKLKPCPWCQGKADVYENPWGCGTNCLKCGAEGPTPKDLKSRESAAEAWGLLE